MSPYSSGHDSDSNRWGPWWQWLLVVMVFAAAFVCLRDLMEIGPMIAKYKVDFGRKPLPPITEWIPQYATYFLFAAIFFPVAALATFALQDRWQAGWVLVGLGLAAGSEALIVLAALRLPFIEIIKQMGSSAGG